MAQKPTDIEALRERLTTLLADWGAEMSLLLRQLETSETALADSQSKSEDHSAKLKQLEDRAKGQADLIDTLQSEAGDASKLRSDVRAQDLEIERLKSELESKQELVKVLRRDVDGLDKLKAELKRKDLEIEQSGERLRELTDEIKTLNESSANEAAEEHAEIAALKAELDARKTLIKSLRADSERIVVLEEQLDAKRAIVTTLEESMNRQAQTMDELRRSSEVWKKKYQELKAKTTNATSAELRAISETDVAALQQLQTETDAPERTVAIDMKKSLDEARRKAAETEKS